MARKTETKKAQVAAEKQTDPLTAKRETVRTLVSDPDGTTTIPQQTNAALAPSLAQEPAQMFRYRRRPGFRPYKIGGNTYEAGQVYETPCAGTIPAAFLDGWDVLDDPSNMIAARLPEIRPTEGGFDVFSAEGRKLNDRPLSMKRAEEFANGLNS